MPGIDYYYLVLKKNVFLDWRDDWISVVGWFPSGILIELGMVFFLEFNVYKLFSENSSSLSEFRKVYAVKNKATW